MKYQEIKFQSIPNLRGIIFNLPTKEKEIEKEKRSGTNVNGEENQDPFFLKVKTQQKKKKKT